MPQLRVARHGESMAELEAQALAARALNRTRTTARHHVTQLSSHSSSEGVSCDQPDLGMTFERYGTYWFVAMPLSPILAPPRDLQRLRPT